MPCLKKFLVASQRMTFLGCLRFASTLLGPGLPLALLTTHVPSQLEFLVSCCSISQVAESVLPSASIEDVVLSLSLSSLFLLMFLFSSVLLLLLIFIFILLGRFFHHRTLATAHLVGPLLARGSNALAFLAFVPGSRVLSGGESDRYSAFSAARRQQHGSGNLETNFVPGT